MIHIIIIIMLCKYFNKMTLDALLIFMSFFSTIAVGIELKLQDTRNKPMYKES